MFARALMLSTALLCASAAEAAPRSLSMARVSVADLDLATDAGARAMLRRLSAAARELCGEEFSPLFPAAQGRAWRCRRTAVAAAVERLDAPRLTFAYAEWLAAETGANP